MRVIRPVEYQDSYGGLNRVRVEDLCRAGVRRITFYYAGTLVMAPAVLLGVPVVGTTGRYTSKLILTRLGCA